MFSDIQAEFYILLISEPSGYVRHAAAMDCRENMPPLHHLSSLPTSPVLAFDAQAPYLRDVLKVQFYGPLFSVQIVVGLS
jgi:hypothetical protein